MNSSQKGFSLIEILIVIVILGILTVFAIPSVIKAKELVEIESASASMKSIVSAQTSFYANHGRYARLGEINTTEYGMFGVTDSTGEEVERGEFTFKMTPPYTDQDLKDGFEIVGTKVIYGSPTPVVLTINHRGNIVALY